MLVIFMILVLVVLSILGTILSSNAGIFESEKEFGGFVLAILSGFGAIAMTVMLIINHAGANSKIAQYNSTKETIETSRQNEMSELERASLIQKIIEVNQEIASYKYWNTTIFEGLIPDKLARLEELK